MRNFGSAFTPNESNLSCEKIDIADQNYHRLLAVQENSESEMIPSRRRISSKLSEIISSCKSCEFCENCQNVALMKQEARRSIPHPIDTCESLGECLKCQAAMRQSLEQRQSSLRKSSDEKSINIAQSKSLYQPSNSSVYSEFFYPHQPRRLTATPASIESRSFEQHKKSLKSVPSILASCRSLGVCKDCTECLIDLAMPTRSFVQAACSSHETCDKCNEVLEDFHRKKSYTKKKPSRASYKLPSLTHTAARNLTSSDSDDQSIRNSQKRRSRKPMRKSNARKESSAILSDSSGQSLYDHVKEAIDKQNNVIIDINMKIDKLVNLNSADSSLTELRKTLNAEKSKLRDMAQVAMYEQRIRNDNEWKPIKINLFDELC